MSEAAKKKRRYSDEERASYVVMLQAAGYPDKKGALQEVVNYSGVNERVLRRWFKGTENPPPDKIVRQKRGGLVDALEDIAWRLVRHVKDPEVIAEMSGQQATVSIGILIDKIRLLSDEPTEKIAIILKTGMSLDEI